MKWHNEEFRQATKNEYSHPRANLQVLHAFWCQISSVF